MKNKDRYDLTELKIKWESGILIEVLDGDERLFITNGWTDKMLLESLIGWLEDEYYILNDKEREYLSAVIRPWRDKVKDIVKKFYNEFEYIVIEHYDEGYLQAIRLPLFEQDTMYKGMELDRLYTLEELNI